MQDQIDRDLKAAMLAKDKQKTEVLKGLKSAMQYEAVSANSPDRRLDDPAVQKVLARESKKRLETAQIYQKAGEQSRAQTELDEKQIIDAYLPKQLSEDEITKAVQQEIAKLASPTPADIGRVIGSVKSQLGAAADGATVARIVKEQLSR